MRKILTTGGLALLLLANGSAAKVSEEEAAQLGTSLTPVGANPAANADGSIPAYSGSMLGLPPGLDYAGPGTAYPDPYADDPILHSITAANMEQHSGFLSPGLQAMFQLYPDSFRVDVYPTHRDGAYSDLYLEKLKYNALHAELYNGEDGIRGFTGSVAFPIPKSGAEVIWNTRSSGPNYTLAGTYSDIAVFSNGSRSVRRSTIMSEYPYVNPDNKVGMEEPDLGIWAARVMTTVHEPLRDKGTITAIFEPYDYITHAREAWRYLPGSRRVRRAPTVGYDTPDGPGGFITVDDTLGFNGAMDRFEWKLLGKQELFVPFHNYAFDDTSVDYDELLPPFHANPDYVRYEKRRVWVVEATLREGKRHIYGKRRFYVDEDSWNIVMTENYDGRGELWKVVLINSLYEYNTRGYVNRAMMFHELRAGGYIIIRLVNDSTQMNYKAGAKGEAWYSPSNVRKLGRR
ncbi:MAG: DUF1329 domain-containing protein [Halieaceae bacterium]